MNNSYLKILNNTIRECPERLSSLKKYYPFYSLYGTKCSVEGYEHINMGEICISLLSFLFYEDKLRNQEVTYINIKDFLEMLLDRLYKIAPSKESLDRFTAYVLDKIQGKDGAGHYIKFPAYEQDVKDVSVCTVKYITKASNELTRKQGYKITPDGIDFLLTTKEFAEESKITISLILLKKLITDSEYDSALLSLTHVNAEVIKQIAKVYEIEMNLMYGGKAGYNAFVDYRNLADKRQKEEEELFIETMEQVRHLREDFAAKVLKSEIGEKEKNAFKCLDEMDKELNKTVELHQQLLGKVVILTRKADEILKQKRAKLLKPAFDFMGYMEKLNTVGSAENLRYSLAPFLPLKFEKSFSISKLNDIFNMASPEVEQMNMQIKEEADIRIDTDKFNRGIRARVLHNYKYVINFIYDILIEKEEVTMNEIVKTSSEIEKNDILKNPDFIGVIIDFLRLNEKTVLEEVSNSKKNKVKEEEDEKSSCILEKAISTVMHERNMSFGIAVETIRDSVVEIAPGYSMTNVIIKRKF